MDEHYQILKIQSSAPDYGRKHRPKHVEPTWNTRNKLIYIHLVHLIGDFHSFNIEIIFNDSQIVGIKLPTVLACFNMYTLSNSFISSNLIHNSYINYIKLNDYMFRASSAHPQEVNVVNYTCMQPLVFSFSVGGRLVHLLRGDW